jgi:hypothetical protein
MDVLNLWIWHSEELVDQDRSLAQCRERFPDKPLIMGCYLRDYTHRAPVALDLVKVQWESVLRNLETGLLQGFSILSANLIDGHQEQANWIRDLIAAHS